MRPETFVIVALIPGLSLLPQGMDTPDVRAFLLAIGLHESKLSARRQVKGPARSYFQFERAGVVGVLHHPASRDHAADVLRQLDYGALFRRPKAVHDVLEHSDPLATAFARLLLRTLPAPLPTRAQDLTAYAQYREAWRPEPVNAEERRSEWPDAWAQAWAIVERLP